MQRGIISDGDGSALQGCSWILAPTGADKINIRFQFFDLSPDDLHMQVMIDVCSDLDCTESSPFSGSPYQSLDASFQNAWNTINASFVRVGFLNLWTGHTQARFVLLYNTDTTPLNSISCSSIPIGFWNHIIAVVESAEIGSISARIYVNGTLLATKTQPAPSPFNHLVFSGSAGVSIGRVYPMGTPFGYLKGDVDEIAVWNQSLSQDQVVHEMTKSCSESEGTIVCYSFDNSTYTRTGDETFQDLSVGVQSNGEAVNGSKFLPWCVSRDDNGELLVQNDGSICTIYRESWGFCTEKALLPGVGLNYDLEEFSNISNVSFTNMPGCANIPLQLEGNNAGRFHSFYPF